MFIPISELRKKSDVELLHLFHDGNQNAIAVLFSRYKSKICYYIYPYVKSREITEDIYQEVIYKALVNLRRNKYSDKGKFYSWLLQIAKNHVIDYHRTTKNKKYISYVINDDEEEINIFDILRHDSIQDTDISASLIKEEIRKNNKNTIKKLINQLPLEQREVLILRMYYGWSFKEIAQYSNVSINTSLGRMRYALNNLEKMIRKKSLKRQLLCG